jgi:hypothetical protein
MRFRRRVRVAVTGTLDAMPERFNGALDGSKIAAELLLPIGSSRGLEDLPSRSNDLIDHSRG